MFSSELLIRLFEPSLGTRVCLCSFASAFRVMTYEWPLPLANAEITINPAVIAIRAEKFVSKTRSSFRNANTTKLQQKKKKKTHKNGTQQENVQINCK